MARAHYWHFLLNSEGQPISNAQIWVYLAGSLTPANLYNAETGSYITGPPSTYTFQSYEDQTDTDQLIKTDSNGYFEFWIGDKEEVNGYSPSQKFKVKWFKAGIANGEIDYINIVNYSDGADGQGFEWKGMWQTGVTYDPYDIISAVNPVVGEIWSYNCILDHQSTLDSQPSSGADWEDYWDVFISGGGTSGSSGTSGTTGTSGTSGSSGTSGLTQIKGGYIHTQSVAASTWNIEHNLGLKYVNLEVCDNSDNWILPESITYTDSNNLVVTFGDDLVSGYASVIAGLSTSGTSGTSGTSASGISQILSKTSDYTVTTSDFGKTIRFSHATTAGTMTLPSVGESDDGARLSFIKSDAARLTLSASDSDVIYDSAAGGTIYSDSQYATITLEYVHGITAWIIISSFGTWTTT